MITATRILPAGSWSGTPADTLTLERDDRHRRRLVMRCVGKTVFLLDLKEAAVMKDGDALELEDGRLILVQAVPERLLEITASSPAELVRVAWHLGNRHLPTQLFGDRLRIRYDHVIEDMLKGLGAFVATILAPFDPEGGAYGHGEVHGHDHGHSHHHDHDHEHGPEHHHHEHGEGCGHDHDHASHDHAEHAHGGHEHHDHKHGEGCGCGHSHDHDYPHDHVHGHDVKHG